MNKKAKLLLLILIALAIAAIASFLSRRNIAVLEPAGLIAGKERRLIIFTLLLSLVVVVPVYAMAFWFSLKYRETNHKAKYRPEWDHSIAAETVWWAVPALLITILAGITWQSSHDLDPFKALSSQNKPMTVQVVALDWKWLFIYPSQKVASVNYVQLPVNTPIDFEITSDAPMNSFWIPQLGGQIYAMSGMSTHLHLMASRPGLYKGSSANLSGRGFAGMHFDAVASSDQDFKLFIDKASQSVSKLDTKAYNLLAKPSVNKRQAFYSSADPNLYSTIISKYVLPKAVTQYKDGL